MRFGCDIRRPHFLTCVFSGLNYVSLLFHRNIAHYWLEVAVLEKHHFFTRPYLGTRLIYLTKIWHVLVSRQFLQSCLISKESEGIGEHMRNGQKWVKTKLSKRQKSASYFKKKGARWPSEFLERCRWSSIGDRVVLGSNPAVCGNFPVGKWIAINCNLIVI